MKKWCCRCHNVWQEHDRCGAAHLRHTKEVASVDLDEVDRGVILTLIEQEKELPWRYGLKLFEKLMDTEAEVKVQREERDVAEKREHEWQKAASYALRDAVASRTPAEAMEQIVARYQPGAVEREEAYRDRADAPVDESEFLTMDEQARLDVTSIVRELVRARALIARVVRHSPALRNMAMADLVQDAEEIIGRVRAEDILKLASSERTEKLAKAKREAEQGVVFDSGVRNTGSQCPACGAPNGRNHASNCRDLVAGRLDAALTEDLAQRIAAKTDAKMAGPKHVHRYTTQHAMGLVQCDCGAVTDEHDVDPMTSEAREENLGDNLASASLVGRS